MSATCEPTRERKPNANKAENRDNGEDPPAAVKGEGCYPAVSNHCLSPANDVQGGRIDVGILGATGVVGQRFVFLLHAHPWFRVVAIAGSARVAGRNASKWPEGYGQTVKWHLTEQTPLAAVGEMELLGCDAELFKKRGCALVFSALSAEVAGETEKAFAQAGMWVFSNARTWRSASCVPILLPSVNSAHINLVLTQESYVEAGSGIITNANCTTTGLATALAPILRTWGIERVIIATLQACSGAGYPGMSAMDMLDNVIPHIKDEEEKLEWEPQKILGELKSTDVTSSLEIREAVHGSSAAFLWESNSVSQDQIESLNTSARRPFILPAKFQSNAMCHRVPVTEGHTISVLVDLPTGSLPSTACHQCVADTVETVMKGYKPPEDIIRLPSCPPRVLSVLDDACRPQPRLDRMRDSGMCVSVGPVKARFSTRLQSWTLKFTLLVHNTVLGAAGCSVLNAELALVKGFVRTKDGQKLLPRHTIFGETARRAVMFESSSDETIRADAASEPAEKKKRRCKIHNAESDATILLAPSREILGSA